ncbi:MULTISPECIES: TetR/AcrR family transcriptional regulator [Gordonia]|uniref:TetR family transcriptional regulator n=1 Tax=Gordonia alkanivorans CGMCC 6845 TaxID=1423140 RepID=W9DKE2_9ACTN|nr:MULTISPECIES: TetR/AcrR family transcriptional regulator [Gordonia]ETA07311.1 TetR family transcriptional regulator [Gordonia alkanivorans CGMCC 6845]MDH3007787.1 TetR/AcrR family transcriptional regulator [Gordonia alkanivorans]MDH3010694.1 TetR/AcrR family transcriptional regulator [Gordonia alkanivorans]MDH3015410.1 TetR/AcrR family transcriptional regulator [Gordonia alkanivorans]MDH3020144.1 TetR/AcrR family transcriptional regulator [Gordonia alkanivorans]
MELWPNGATSTRERLLAAMLECITESGYRETTIADVVRVAQTSRRTFYQEFADKQDCFFELLRETNRFMIARIAEGVDPEGSPEAQVRQAVTAYATTSDRYPGLMLSWIRELPALGGAAAQVKNEAMDDWVDLFVGLTSTPTLAAAGVKPISRQRAVFLWGGVRELTASAVESGSPLSDIIEPATAACFALMGPAPS